MGKGITFSNVQGVNRTIYTLKTPGSEIDPEERVHWGQTPIRVNDDPEISQLDAECDPELGQSDPIISQVCRKLTNFRVIFDPEWSLAPMDPFPGHADPGVFRVYNCAVFRFSSDVRLRYFQYKILNGICYMNNDLFRMKISNSDK